jgi:hypothetical protein
MNNPAAPTSEISKIKGALITVAKDVDIAASDALKFVAGVEKKSPAAFAGLAVVLGSVAKVLGDVQAAAANPAQAFSVSFDQATAADLKAVWPDIVQLCATWGIKL